MTRNGSLAQSERLVDRAVRKSGQKIAYLSAYSTAPWLTIKYASALAADGAQVKVFATEKNVEGYAQGIVKADVPVVIFRDIGNLPFLWRLRRFIPSPPLLYALVRERADVYIAGHPDDLPISALTARLTGGRLAYFPFEYYPALSYGSDAERARYRRREQRYAKTIYCWVSLGDRLSNEYRRVYGIERSVHTVYSGIPREYGVKPVQLRTRLGLGAQDIILLYTGTISKSRGLWDVVDVLGSLPDNIYFVVIGGADNGVIQPEMEELQCYADRLGVAHRLRTHPKVPQDELMSYTVEADIGILPIRDVSLSYRYSNPGKLFEFIGAGLPLVVRGDLEQICWYVQSRGLGEVFRSGSPESLVSAISRLAGDAAYRRQCATNARRVHLEEACWEIQSQKLRQAVFERPVGSLQTSHNSSQGLTGAIGCDER